MSFPMAMKSLVLGLKGLQQRPICLVGVVLSVNGRTVTSLGRLSQAISGSRVMPKPWRTISMSVGRDEALKIFFCLGSCNLQASSA